MKPRREALSLETRRFLSLDNVYLAAAVAVIMIVPLLTRVAPHDFWWHVAMGRIIVREGWIPTVDSFSFTRAGEPYFNQGWLAQCVMYALHQAGGLPLLVVVQAVLMAVAYLLLLWMVVRKTGRLRLAAAVLLLAIEPNAYTNWSIRPQSYAIPLFASFLVILTGYRQRWWRTLWPLVPMMAVWVNLHGSFPLGLGLMGLVLLGEGIRRKAGDSGALPAREWWRLAGYTVAVALATLANPTGPRVLGYVSHLMTAKSVVNLVTEWAPPTPRDAAGAIFFALVIALFVALIYARRRPALTDLFLMLAFLWLGLSAGRNIVWFAMVAYLPLAEALASHWSDAPPASKRDGAGQGIPAANAVLVSALATAVVLSLPWIRPLLGRPVSLLTEDTPVKAVEKLRALPPEERPKRLFHTTGFGSYLIWAAPEQPVFIDPRFEFYPVDQINDCRFASAGYNVEETLARYRIDGLLLDRKSQEKLEERARASGRWCEVYRDATAVLMVPARPAP
ncbi:MAG TPA: hypothetical protein PLY56_07750 [Armatimonadota bacterium]|nr:hypothetical protein [Armatimonadota bacterium]